MKNPLNLLSLIFKAGPCLLLAFEILSLIKKTVDTIQPGSEPNVAQISRKVFKMLPSKWKSPDGPASEEETINVVFEGCKFYLAVRALFSKP